MEKENSESSSKIEDDFIPWSNNTALSNTESHIYTWEHVHGCPPQHHLLHVNIRNKPNVDQQMSRTEIVQFIITKLEYNPLPT